MNQPARRVEPSRSLLQNAPYVSADRTATDGVLARWLWERSSENPANYPDDSDCNEVDAAGTYTGKQA